MTRVERKPTGAFAMTLREFYVERRRAEHPIFLSVLESLPRNRLDYKPHERGPSAQQIVWTMTSELLSCLEAAKEFRTQWHGGPVPSFEEMLALFEQRSSELTEVVASSDEAAWNRVAQFYYKGKLVSEQPVGQFLWYIHFDAIHHRGQL